MNRVYIFIKMAILICILPTVGFSQNNFDVSNSDSLSIKRELYNKQKKSIKTIVNGQEIKIITDENIKKVEVFDIVGSLVADSKSKTVNVTRTGLFMVKIQTDVQIVVQKVMVR